MTDLTNIFPINYPDRPSQQDIEFMFQDILNRSDSVDKVVYKIEMESCPYYKEAFIRILQDRLHDWNITRNPIAGREYGDSWFPYWQEPQDKIRKLVEKYQTEQLHTILPAPADELPIEPQPAPRPTVTQHVKNLVIQVVNDLLAIKEMAQSQTIIIQNLHIHNYNAPIGQYAHHIDQQNNK